MRGHLADLLVTLLVFLHYDWNKVLRVLFSRGVIAEGEEPHGEDDRNGEQANPAAADLEEKPSVNGLMATDKANGRYSSNDALGRGHWDSDERSCNISEGHAQLGGRTTQGGKHGELNPRTCHSISVQE